VADYVTTPIPANPTLEPNSATKAASVLVGAAGTTNQGIIGLGFGQKLVGTSSDPSVTVSPTADTNYLIAGTGALLTKWGPFRIPSKASGGGESTAPLTASSTGTTSSDYEDHWLFLKDPARTSTAAPYGVQFDLWRYRIESGNMAAASLTVWALNSDGTTSFNRLDGGGTGAGLSTQGLITRAEMTKTTVGSFGHALYFASRSDMVSSDFRVPATKTDGTVAASTSTLPEGCRVQLDPSINISALTALSTFERNVALTLQSHGAYLTDRTGSTTPGMNFQVEGGDPTDLRIQAPTSTVPWGYAGDPIRAAGVGTASNPAGQYSTFIPYDYYEMPDIPWRNSAGAPNMRVLAAWDGSVTTAGATLSATATLTSGSAPASPPPSASTSTVLPGSQAVIWTFAVGPHTALPNWALVQARSRRVTWRLTTPSDATFSIDGESADALQLSELVTDLWVYRNGSPLFRGRVGTTSDSYDGNLLTSTVNVADYKGVLARRELIEGDTLTYTNVDQSAIALGLINSTQGHSGGQLGIVAGVGASTGVLRARTYQAGLNVGETLDKLSNVQNGFEWDITPTATAALHLDVFSPTRGSNNNVVLDVGGRVRTFQRQFDPGLYANAVRVTGANTTGGTAAGALTAVNQAASNIGSAAQGRWDSQVGDTTIVEQTTLTERAAAELAESQVILPQWTVELQPNGWGGPSDVWLGDTVTLIGKIGRLNDVGPLRVQEVECSFDDDDTVTTKITLGQVPLSRRFRLRTFSQRLTALERR